jgi:hypothetical protein
MFRDFFNRNRKAAQARPQQPQATATAEVSRKLMKLLVSGPAGGTDPALWTLLLRDPPQRRHDP